MNQLLRDISYSLRRLRQAPAFTAIVVVTLALGIGANTAIFSVVDTVMLRALPYRDPGRLVAIEHFYPSFHGMEAPVSAAGFRDYRDKTRSFEAVAVETRWSANLTGVGEPQRVSAVKVSGDWFKALGVPAELGRTIARDDDQPGHEHVLVVTDGAWRRLFGSDPHAIGRTIQLNGERFQLVGVMPPGFHSFYSNADVMVPLALTAQQFTAGYTNEYLSLTARLAPGATLGTAQAEMHTFAENLKHANPNQFAPDWTLKVRSFDDLTSGTIRPTLLILLGAVGFVLLIACANVANLLLARAATRIKEIAIRAALGAERRALVRQLLTESLVIALAGGVLGVLLAEFSVKSLVALNPNLPRAGEVGIHVPVLAFALGISLLTGVIFGLMPALHASRTNLQDTLRDGGRMGTADMAGRTLRRCLVIAEVALALTLLIGAGLTLQSVARLQRVNPGFDATHLLTFDLSLPKVEYPTDTVRAQFGDRLMAQLDATPGVKVAGLVNAMPFNNDWSTASFEIEGLQVPKGQNGPWGDYRVASPGYFKALEIPLRRGRYLDANDVLGSQPVVVIDDEFARKYFPHDNPIGKRITFGPNRGSKDSTWITIVGVVGHTAFEGLDAEPRIQYYLSEAQTGLNAMSVAVRTVGDPSSMVAAVKRAVQAVDPRQPLAAVNDMETKIGGSMGQRKLAMILLGVFAVIALAIACIGIYGVMSYSVAQRTRELGVRMALGANRGRVLSLVVGQGMALAVAGAVLGLIGAFSLTRLLTNQLYSVKATDPTTFVGVTALLLAIALAATLVPAMRATRVDPVVALRED
jgi:putative ABC transport system permease protein